MQKTLKKELSFSLDTLERYRAKYGRSASLDTNATNGQHAAEATQMPAPAPMPSLFTKAASPPRMTKLQELQQKKEAYMRAREQEREMEELQRKQDRAATSNGNSNANVTVANSSSSSKTESHASPTTVSTTAPARATVVASIQSSKLNGCYANWSNNHSTLASQPWCAISDLMYFCDKYEFKTLSTRDLRTHQEIVAEVQVLLSGKAPFDQRTRFPGNIHDPENLWVCIGRCASVEYHLQRIISTFRKPLNQLTPDKQRTVRQNFHLAVSELRLDISARISEVRLYDRLVFEREFRLQWQDEA